MARKDDKRMRLLSDRLKKKKKFFLETFFPERAVLRALLKKSLATSSAIFLAHQPKHYNKIIKACLIK